MKWADYESNRVEAYTISESQSQTSPSYGQSQYSTIKSNDGRGYETESIVSSSNRNSVIVSVVPGFPSDEELYQEIRHILSTSGKRLLILDLMTVTKKSVRDRLSRLFGMDVSPKKDFIHHAIDNILKGNQ